MTERPLPAERVRQERIRRIKERIDRGEYGVPADAVADAVISWYRRWDPPRQR